MAVSGQYFVVGGAPAASPGGTTGAGAVYVFKEPSTGWAGSPPAVATLTAPDEEDGDLPETVAIDSTTIVASAPGATVDGVLGAGVVYVYSGPGWTSTATPSAQLSPSGEPADSTGYHNFGAAGRRRPGQHRNRHGHQRGGLRRHR